MTDHTTGTREEWLAARLDLLEAEKELRRRSDELARRRQELPWVRVDKAYRFETEEGTASLADLFRGHSQLLIYHFMFGPDYTAGCPTCSTIADGFNGFVVHLANHDVTLSAVSRAPLAKLQEYKRRMGWTFRWASSYGSDFNCDFQVAFTEEQQQSGIVEYNFHAMNTRSDLGDPQTLAVYGTDVATTTREAPGRARSRARTASSTTPTRRTRAGSTRCGACTSGSTAHHGGATRRSCEDLVTSEVPAGSAATTSTRGRLMPQRHKVVCHEQWLEARRHFAQVLPCLRYFEDTADGW